MQCVADYALTALARNDGEAVNLTCGVLLARVPVGVTTFTVNTRKEWLRSLSRILEALVHPIHAPSYTRFPNELVFGVCCYIQVRRDYRRCRRGPRVAAGSGHYRRPRSLRHHRGSCFERTQGSLRVVDVFFRHAFTPGHSISSRARDFRHTKSVTLRPLLLFSSHHGTTTILQAVSKKLLHCLYL